MKIISDFYDFYDSVAYSDEPLFIRHETIKEACVVDKEINDKVDEIFKRCPRPEVREKNVFSGVDVSFLCFCGKMYFFLEHSFTKYSRYNEQLSRHNLKACNISAFIKKLKSCDMETKLYHSFFSLKHNKMELKKAFSQFHKDYELDNIAYKLNLHFKTPIVLITNEKFRVNTYKLNILLGELNFQQTLDPYSAYQEIEMFLGTILVDNQDKNDIMSDELKRDSKGMDEYSFKQVGPKARKRKEKK